ncbi:Sugar-binding periplasmic protein [Clostridium acetobutylicum EA 2018]|uniref:ABC transporter substrate-binding protein n=1 Tax=Clostridium acetobutylicum TaxID=1488 RepID=UPI000200A6C7|nr:ABC transporter substrate-binding protein [Clostridium acetobutylicum]ADZ19715.1 Sugar-binding periplasmic protein [Clostridium acetobutylicum EA 2018]
MKMSKKRLAIIGVVIVIIVAIGMYPVFSKKLLRSSDPNTLTIYALAYNGKLNYDIEAIVNGFKQKYPNIKLNIVKFNLDGGGYEKYNEKILSDTLAGGGPDIIYFNPEETNARAFQKSGMLEDLKPYIEKDKDFNKEDYNSKLLNAGMYKGKLTFIPTDYCIPAYITTKELLEKNNIKITENMSQNDFMKSLSGYISNAKSTNGKTLFAKSIDVGDFIASSGFECVNYENKKMYFDTKEFKDIMENYKKIYNSTPKKTNNESGEEGLQGIKNGSTLFSTDNGYTCGVEFFESESTIKGLTGQTQVINSFPTYNGGNKTIAIAEDLIGMSKTTLNKKAAYDFIKIALSEKIQCDNRGYTPPINKKSQIDIKNKYLNEEVGKNDKENKVILNKLSDDFNKYYDRVTNNIDEVRILDTNVDKLIKECMTPYFENKSSYDSALKTLENKVKLYINE